MKRRLKIEEMGDPWRRKTIAAIRLKGKWLREVGFSPGSHALVTVLSPGVLELRVAQCEAAEARAERLAVQARLDAAIVRASQRTI